MKFNEFKNIKNNEPIILLAEREMSIKDSICYTFKNVIILGGYEIIDDEINDFISYINNHDNELILVGYQELFRKILPYVKKKKIIKWLFKENLSCLTNGWANAVFCNNVMEFYDRDIIDEILCLDSSTYEVLKNSGYRTQLIHLDVEKSNKEFNKKTKTIGLLGDDKNPNHNTYNQLSAIKMVDYEKVKLIEKMPATKHFIDFFGIKAEEKECIEDVMSDNMINLYVNFTFNNFELILKSMDMGIPCLVGNTDFFDSNETLKKYLVLESDDDIREIRDKINNVIKNHDLIMKEYIKFRKEYIQKVNFKRYNRRRKYEKKII